MPRRNPPKITARWTATVFNYGDWRPIWNPAEMDYMVWQCEICPETRSPHIHLYVRFKKRCRWNKIKAMLPHPEVDHVEGAIDPEKNNLRDARMKAQAERKAKLLAEIERRNEWTGRMALQAACRISDRSGLDLLGDLVREGKIAKKIALNEKCVHVTVYIATAKADTPYQPEPIAAGERIRQRVKTEVLTPDEVAKPVKWKPSVNESGSARFVRLAMERTLAGEELTESELTEAAHNAGIMIGTGTATEAVKAFKRRAEAELARRKRERLGYAPMEARA